MRLLIVILASLFTSSCNKKDEQTSRSEFMDAQKFSPKLLKQARDITDRMLNEPVDIRLPSHAVIRDANTAITIAEALAFSEFGEKEVRDERPYNVMYIDGYWVVTGSMKEATVDTDKHI